MSMDFEDSAHQASVEHFQSIPWISKLLSDPSYITIPTRCREPKVSTEDSFIAVTLKTSTTLPYCLTQIKASSLPLPDNDTSDSSLSISRIRVFWQLNSGINGFPNIGHGGLSSVLCDESMGILLTSNHIYGPTRGNALDLNEMTVFLNVQYRAPLETPGAIMVETWVTKKDRRKIFLSSRIVDSKNRDVVTAEGMYLVVKSTRM